MTLASQRRAMRVLIAMITMPVGAVAMAQSAPAIAVTEHLVSVDAPIVALTHVRLIDGTGTPARADQTVLIEGATIRAVGPSGGVRLPAGAQVLDLTGKTVMPGLIGLHDHLYYASPLTGTRPMLYSYPRLFLAAGVTTIRTTGSQDPYQELNLRAQIEAGKAVGPTIVATGPYLEGAGKTVGWMHGLNGPEDARRTVRYWAEEGITWFKAYTQISRAELAGAIDEAHRHGMKVTAHLCSVGFREAVALGIDNLEHGLLTDTEFWPGKQPDVCPTPGDSAQYDGLDIGGADVQRTIHEMVAHHVAMTSTLAVFELSAASRVPFDPRVYHAFAPAAAAAVRAWYDSARTINDGAEQRALAKAMAFERAFVRAGGLLAAGSDPCCGPQIAGYGDQRNFELLVEAGFVPEVAIEIMTLNGARVLGMADQTGSIAPGKQADLVVLDGDPTQRPVDIRTVRTVFRHGVGYDPAALTASITSLVGLK
jgi:imidazolonepropionase-like amidohydrolase